MKIWKNFCLFPLIFASLSAGCGSGTKTTTPTPSAPIYQTITVDGDLGFLQTTLLPWANLEKPRSGIQLEIAPPGQGDIQVGRVWNLVSGATQNQLALPSDDLISSRNPLRFDDFLPWVRQRFLVWDRQVFGLPLAGDGWVCLYRKDWLNQAVQKKGLSKLPSLDTWEDYLSAARLMAEANLGPTPGKILSSPGESAKEWEDQFLWIHSGYSARAIGSEEKKDGFSENELFGYLYNVSNGEFQPGKAASAKAAKIWLELNGLRVSPTKGITPIDEFLQGKAGLGIYPLQAVARLQSAGLVEKVGILPVPGASQYSNAKGDLEASNHPNRRPVLGSRIVLGMVRKSCQNPEAAWRLLADFSAPLGEKWALGENTAGISRNDQALRMRFDRFDLDVAKTNDLKEILKDEVLHPKIQNPAMYPRRADSLVRSEKLKQALEGLRDETTVKAFPDQWKASIDSLEKLSDSDRRRLARLSAGLIP